MRPIKFRAWDGEKFGYFGFHPTMFYYPSETYIESNIVSGCYIEFPSINDTWQQFTGLLDKNGKEIFHGDILMFKNPDGEHFYEGLAIVTEPETLGYDFQPVPSLTNQDMLIHGYDSSMFSHDFDNEVEVIGNIYENPELLK